MYRFFERIHRYAGHTPAAVRWRFALAAVVLLPVWVPVLLWSLHISRRWRNLRTVRRFMRRHELAFAEVDPTTLRIEAAAGGISNASMIWRCRTHRGAEVDYFVKVFLPLGTLWAQVCPWVSPFPRLRPTRRHERAASDVVSRLQLTAHRLPVPRLVAFDPVDHVAVSERLQGEMVTEVLRRVNQRRFLLAQDRTILAQCGKGLARMHAAGFAMVDAQPANCLWVPERGRVHFIDFEYCTREDLCAWDLAFFLAFVAAQLSGTVELEARQLILDGYRSIRRVEPAMVLHRHEELRALLPVFQAILALRQCTPEELVGVSQAAPEERARATTTA